MASMGAYLSGLGALSAQYQDPQARASDIQAKSGSIKAKTNSVSVAAANTALSNQGSTGIMGFTYE